MKKKLLAIYYRPPLLGLPQNSFGQYYILKVLETIYEIRTLSFQPPVDLNISGDYLRPEFSRSKKLFNLFFKQRSPHLTHYFTNEMAQLYNDAIKEFEPDLIYVDNIVMMQYPVKYKTSSQIWFFDDDSRLFNNKIRPKNNFIEKIRNTGLEKFELKAIEKSDKTFCITAEETSLLRSKGFDNIYTLPYPIDNNIYFYNWEPLKDKFNVLFVGDFSHPPNIEAAKIITREFYPVLDKNDIIITIVGRNISKIRKYLKRCNNIEIFENTRDVREFYWKSSLFIAPIFSGAGMRIKILEAAACGIPILMTDIANLGINLSPELAFFANSYKQMINTILSIKHMSDSDLVKIGKGASQAVIDKFGLEKMTSVYNDILGYND